jgi:uncharacterized BrkB/YihY/UPF0761 family membrane protein
MALMDFPRSRDDLLSPPRGTVNRVTATEKRRNIWQRTALEIAGTFLVLMGIAVGILMLRFALVLLHGIPQ